MNKGWYKSYSYLFKPLYNYQEDCRPNYYDNSRRNYNKLSMYEQYMSKLFNYNVYTDSYYNDNYKKKDYTWIIKSKNNAFYRYLADLCGWWL